MSQVLPDLVVNEMLEADTDISRIASIVDFAIITVPTPLGNNREPDLSSVVDVAETAAKQLRRGQFGFSAITIDSVLANHCLRMVKAVVLCVKSRSGLAEETKHVLANFLESLF